VTAPESGTADDTTDKKADDRTLVEIDEVGEGATPEPVDTATPTEATDENTAEVTEGDSPDSEADDAQEPDVAGPAAPVRRISMSRVFIFGVLPVLALLLALGAGFLKWQDSSVRDSATARTESAQAAKDATVALLSYRPDTVDKDLGAARDLLTGDFKNAYTSLTDDVVIPGAKQKQISAVASVPAVASVSADRNHAVALVFVNQTVLVGTDAPTDTASSVRVTMEKIGGHWLISGFDPV
jgi:Mce-associated membrane protein